MVDGAFGPSRHRLKVGAFGPKLQLTVEPAKYLFYLESSKEECLNVGSSSTRGSEECNHKAPNRVP